MEIERKFLVKLDDVAQIFSDEISLNGSFKMIYIEQSYLVNTEKISVRVRIQREFESKELSKFSLIKESKAFMNIKEATIESFAERLETEFEIPFDDALHLYQTSRYILRKNRNIIHHDGQKWELDVFQFPFFNFALAEIELPSLDTNITLPSWVGREVTHEKKFLNSELAKNGWHETF